MIGIVGGMGPRAAVAFQSCVLDAACVTLDSHYPALVMLNVSDIPSRTKYLSREGASPIPKVLQVIERLKLAGADFCALPCNTLHFLIDELQDRSPLPVLSMLDAVERHIASRLSTEHSVRVMGTNPTIRGTSQHPPLYDAIFRARGVAIEYLSISDEHAVRDVIDEVKSGRASAWLTERLSAIVTSNLPSPRHHVLLACSELDAVPLVGMDTTRLHSAGRALAALCIETERHLALL